MEPIFDWRLMADYLKNNLNVVKNSVKDCTFLSFLTSKEFDENKQEYVPFTAYYAIIKNQSGGRDKVTLKLDKPYFDLKEQDFRDLASYLGSKAYEKTGNRASFTTV